MVLIGDVHSLILLLEDMELLFLFLFFFLLIRTALDTWTITSTFIYLLSKEGLGETFLICYPHAWGQPLFRENFIYYPRRAYFTVLSISAVSYCASLSPLYPLLFLFFIPVLLSVPFAFKREKWLTFTL